MAGGSGGTTTEQFIFRAQKSTNHLKALLAKLLPPSGGGYGAGAGAESSGDVDALLSDITDSLSQAITSLRIPTVEQAAAASTGARGSPAGGAGRRRSAAPRRTSQRMRMDGASRMVVLQNGVHDSYTWRKYGQKEILGARFPRSYYRCGHRSGCPAKKQVQQSNADPSKLEITYFEAHTCDSPPVSSFFHSVPDPTTGADAQLVPATTVPVPSAQCDVGRPSSPFRQVPMIVSSNVVRTTAGHLLPAAAVPGAQHYDLVPDFMDMDCRPSLEQEQSHLLHIPSPACSQSELLPVDLEVSKLSPRGLQLALDLDHTLACDLAVPEL